MPKRSPNNLVNLNWMSYSERMHHVSRLIGIVALAFLAGCASQSQKTLAGLDPTKPEYSSESCEQIKQRVWLHQDLKNAKALGGSAAVILLGPAAFLPVLAGSVGLSVADHTDARQMALACGGTPRDALQITGDVVLENSLNLFTRGVAPTPVPSK